MPNLIEEIKDTWKLDAKSESSDRYFFHVNELKNILSGNKAYVIGRKGTGKTAISKYIAGNSDYNIFAEKLSFKNFPFNELYSLTNKSFNKPNQYITIWKYIIYSNICKMMAANESISGEIQPALKQLYAPDPIPTLQRWVKKWTANDFSINVLGTGGKISFKESTSEDSWITRTDVLEQIIFKYADNSSYYVVFDELDEDYKSMNQIEQLTNYTELLTGLFKAVQDIKGIFSDRATKIYPVVFLRDDIYSVIMDPDKTKWDDFKIELEWDKAKIRKLLSYRISRTIDENGEIFPFEKAWGDLFNANDIRAGRQRISAFDYIARSTLLRPRDFVRYIQTCANDSPSDAAKISTTTIVKADKSFSTYLRREFVDEIHGVVPDIDAIFDILSQIRKQTFTLNDSYRAFDAKRRDGGLKTGDPQYVLKILYLFSVIGNQPRQVNQTVFKYINTSAEINFNENFVVHRGLFKSLQIL